MSDYRDDALGREDPLGRDAALTPDVGEQRDADGYRLDEFGNRVDDDGRRVDEDGTPVDVDGEPLDATTEDTVTPLPGVKFGDEEEGGDGEGEVPILPTPPRIGGV